LDGHAGQVKLPGMTPHSDQSPSFFARTNFRNKGIPVGIKQADRLSHMYVIGKTGTGKSTLVETLVMQDIAQGRGMMLIDPHGDLAERIAHSIPAHRLQDVIYFNVPDPAQPFGYNPLKHVREDKISLAASGLLEAFKKMWPDAWGVRMEHVLRNTLLTLLEQPDATLADRPPRRRNSLW
jgi:type IV secretory pathway TraG/TraD family ATPase VirD4